MFNLTAHKNLPGSLLLRAGLLVCLLLSHQVCFAQGNLVAHYQFDLCNLNSSGVAIDNVNGIDGTLNGGVSRDARATSGLKPETCSSVNFSGGTIEIAGLPLSMTSGDQTSVSFWMFWDGADNMMPMGWESHDLWLRDGSFGFNTANSDIYGIPSAGLAAGWHHVAAIFTNNNISANQLYIDGVLQTLTQRRGTQNNSRAVVSTNLRLSGWRRDNGYRFAGRLDEVKVYTGAVNQAQVDADIAYFNNACPFCPPPPPPPPATLIAEYDFDDDWDIAGNLIDSVGGFNGVQSGAITRVATPAEGTKPNTCFGGEFSGGAFDINGLPVSTANGDKTSISFWMKWDGTDSVMPFGWRYHDLWLVGGNFGFNSAGGDLYGISAAGLVNTWRHIAVVFSNNNLTNNKIYIDGVEQVLTQRRGQPNNSRAVVDAHLRLGGWWINNGYRFRGVIDQFKVYNGEIADAQVQLDMADDCLDPNAQWRFDEALWTGAIGEVIDSTGGGHDGTALGFGSGPADPATSIADAALSGNPGTCGYGVFDGVDDYIEIADSGDLDNTNQLTLSAWFKADSLTQTNGTNARGVFSKRPSFSNDVSYGAFFLNGGGNRLHVDIDGTNNRFSSNTQFNVDTWYHIAIVFDGREPASQRVRLYVDGVLDGVFSESSSVIPDTNSNFYIGNLYTGLSQLKVFDGAIDEVNVIALALSPSEVVDLMNARRPCATPLVFLDIDTQGNSASTCVAKPITIRACQDAACNNLINNYDGTIDITVSSNHGDWSINSANGVLTDAIADDGSASYTFNAASDGSSVALNLTNTHAETVTITVADSGVGASTVSSSLTFGDNVFVIDHGDNLHVAGRDQPMTASLYTNDGSNCAVNPLYDGVKNTKLWLSRDAADPAGTAPQINAGSVPDTMSTLFNLNFVNGVAEFNFATTDVGKYQLNIVDDTLLFSDQAIVGDAAIITRPFGFDLQVLGAAGEANAGATDENGGVFMVAAESFTVTVRAVAWEGGDDSNNDGIPDGHDNALPGDNADLSNNASVSSFGLENNGQAESVAVVAYEVAPDLNPSVNRLEDGSAGCPNCIVNSFVAGQGTSANVYYANVGIVELQAALLDGSYLGGATVVGASGFVGRFIPDRFELQNPVITPADASSNPYTYMGQPFLVGYDLVALNSLGLTADNYKEGFAKLDLANEGAFSNLGATVDVAYGAVDLPATERTSRLTMGSMPPLTNWLEGVIIIIDLPMTIEKGASIDGPFAAIAIGINVEDSDGVTFNNLDLEVDASSSGDDAVQIIGSPGELRYGRTFFPPVYGPEIPLGETLAMPFINQYWNGSHFVTNRDDNITVYEDWLATCADADGSDGLICSEVLVDIPSLAGPADVSTALGEDDVNFPITISRPGSGNAGSLDITFAVDDWLQFNWGSGVDTGPTSRVSFGRYRGHDRIIYWREKIN